MTPKFESGDGVMLVVIMTNIKVRDEESQRRLHKSAVRLQNDTYSEIV